MIDHRRRPVALAVALLAAGLAGCGGNASGPPPPAALLSFQRDTPAQAHAAFAPVDKDLRTIQPRLSVLAAGGQAAPAPALATTADDLSTHLSDDSAKLTTLAAPYRVQADVQGLADDADVVVSDLEEIATEATRDPTPISLTKLDDDQRELHDQANVVRRDLGYPPA